MIIVVILRPDGRRQGHHKRGHAQSCQAHRYGFHGRELSHAEAVKPLSIIVSWRQGPHINGHRAR
ncbi:MAG: hypothetical protein E5V77_13190 [Mesorhizobium sp.]|nr:MAG: hypothetical protein E5V77_13190 [Mesorhizobium sp.]